jgi:RNA polymerase sigma-70 factor (ECF subfamily)
VDRQALVDRDKLSQSVIWAELSPHELIWECAKPGNAAAWCEFINRYDRLIRGTAAVVARRWGQGSLEEREDLTQEIYLKLCANGAQVLLSLRGKEKEAIFSYLKIIATNTAHDYFRAKVSQRRGERVTEQISEKHGLGSAGREDMERRLIFQEIDRVLESQTQAENGVRDRTVFRLYYKQGMTAKEIAGLPNINLTVKGVEAVIHRLTARIQELLAQEKPTDSRLNEVGED